MKGGLLENQKEEKGIVQGQYDLREKPCLGMFWSPNQRGGRKPGEGEKKGERKVGHNFVAQAG